MNIAVKGTFYMEVKVGGKVTKYQFDNGVVNAGKNHLLDTFFGGEAKGTWYFGLIAENPVLDAADTLDSHAGWTELTDYIGDRKEVTFTDPASARIISSDAIQFVMNDTVTIAGAFIANAETGDTGILWSTGLVLAFEAPDAAEVNVRYELKVL
jgi:hypothetical protein